MDWMGWLGFRQVSSFDLKEKKGKLIVSIEKRNYLESSMYVFVPDNILPRKGVLRNSKM